MRPLKISVSPSGTQWLRDAARLSLRTKLLALSGLLVIVSGVVFAGLAFSATHDALRSAAGRQLVEAARGEADNVSAEVANLRDDLHQWAHNEVMRDLMIGDLDKRVSRLLRTIREGGESYFDLFCADADGHVIAASAPGLVGRWLGDYAFDPKAVPGATVLRGPVSRSPYPRPTLEAIEPIPHPEHPDRRIGTLVALYDMGAIDQTAMQLRRNLAELGTEVDVLVLDEHGTVIAGSWHDESAALTGRNLRDADWKSARADIPVALARGFEEESAPQVFAAYSELNSVRDGWRVLVTQSIDDALAPVAQLRRTWVIALAAVVVVGLLLAGLLGERMVRPLRALTFATEGIRLFGDEAKPLPVTSGDEIGQLTEAFNTMSSELRGARRELINAARMALAGEMAAGIAHEVRTPLGILRTSAQVLRRSIEARTPKEAELLDIMIAETDRLSHVVTELLDLARPHRPAAQSNDLAVVLARAVEFVRAQAAQQGVRLRQEFSEHSPPAWCDAEQIYQVALNLIVNAMQSMPSGGNVVVRLEAERSGRVAFGVADDGPGIPEDIQDKVFAPFFTTRASGTGLGLALVERIVSAHRGTITVNSSPGEGATFRVTLPVAEEVA